MTARRSWLSAPIGPRDRVSSALETVDRITDLNMLLERCVIPATGLKVDRSYFDIGTAADLRCLSAVEVVRMQWFGRVLGVLSGNEPWAREKERKDLPPTV